LESRLVVGFEAHWTNCVFFHERSPDRCGHIRVGEPYEHAARQSAFVSPKIKDCSMVAHKINGAELPS